MQSVEFIVRDTCKSLLHRSERMSLREEIPNASQASAYGMLPAGNNLEDRRANAKPASNR